MPERSPQHLAAVRSLQYCVICWKPGPVEAAHSNEQAHGKGMGIKASDLQTAALCRECHQMIDSGNKLTREERKRYLQEAVDETKRQLILRGFFHDR